MEMPKLWNKFTQRVGEIKNRTSEYMIDINLQVVQNEFTELICVEVNNLSYIPEGMTGLVIPSQSYAYLKHEGPIEELIFFVNYIPKNQLRKYQFRKSQFRKSQTSPDITAVPFINILMISTSCWLISKMMC